MSSLYPPVYKQYKKKSVSEAVPKYKLNKKEEKINMIIVLTATTFTREVFPAFWSPIRDNSISCLKKRLQSNQI